MGEHKLQWHPAFQAALQIELKNDASHLQFLPEHNLMYKPLRIDTLVIKDQNYNCRQKIGKFFLRHNIIEYKGPDDYFSINDYYKVLGYACIYQSGASQIMKIDPSEITITIVLNYYPRKLIAHLKTKYSIKIEKSFPGIYYIEKGLTFPTQIIVNCRLPPDEYIWLSRLRNNLKIKEDIEVLSEAYIGKDKDPLYESVMDIIMRANAEKYEEAKGMCNALRELFADELKEKEDQAVERGLQRGIEQGIQQGLQQGIQQGLQQGIQQGMEQGLQQGKLEGENRMVQLSKKLLNNNRTPDLMKALDDAEYRDLLFLEFGLV